MGHILILLVLLNAPQVAGGRDFSKAKQQETDSCLPCHSLRIVHSQRLSKETWIRELDKMERWGAIIQERDALLNYLSEAFGTENPPAPPPLSQDGTGIKK